MKPNIRIVLNPILVFAYIFLAIVLFGSSIAVIIAAGIDGLICVPSDSLGIQMLFGFWLLVGIFGFWNCRHVLGTIVLTEDAVFFHIPFQKRVTTPYEKYPYIMHGRYLHGLAGGGYWVHFIVFSKVKLSTEQLYEINNIPNSPDTFKIKYSPRRIKVLLKVLPVSHCYQLNKAFGKCMTDPNT